MRILSIQSIWKVNPKSNKVFTSKSLQILSHHVDGSEGDDMHTHPQRLCFNKMPFWYWTDVVSTLLSAACSVRTVYHLFPKLRLTSIRIKSSGLGFLTNQRPPRKWTTPLFVIVRVVVWYCGIEQEGSIPSDYYLSLHLSLQWCRYWKFRKFDALSI